MALPPPFLLHHFAEVPSTQDKAWEFIKAGGESGLIICAERQTKGRGRQGRVWETPAGNLAMTLAWRMDSPKGRPGDYSLLVAVALFKTLKSFIQSTVDLHIKWPNDLLLNQKKCAGILLEAPEPGWLLIGIGVNLVWAPVDRACLTDFDPKPVTVSQMIERFCFHFLEMTTEYRRTGLGPALEIWHQAAFGLGQTILVHLPHSEFKGIFRGLNDHGACQVELPGGQIRLVQSGEVFFETAAIPNNEKAV